MMLNEAQEQGMCGLIKSVHVKLSGAVIVNTARFWQIAVETDNKSGRMCCLKELTLYNNVETHVRIPARII